MKLDSKNPIQIFQNKENATINLLHHKVFLDIIFSVLFIDECKPYSIMDVFYNFGLYFSLISDQVLLLAGYPLGGQDIDPDSAWHRLKGKI